MYSLNVDRRKKIDIPSQLLNAMKEFISSSHHQIEKELWSVEDFAQHYHISLNEAHWIYQDLINNRLVNYENNKYILENVETPNISLRAMHSLLNVIELNQMKAHFIDKSHSVVCCPIELESYESCDSDRFLKIERVYYGNNIPMIYSIHFYDLNHFKKLENVDLNQKEIWPILETNYQAQKHHSKVRFKGKILSPEQMILFNTSNSLSNYLESFIFEKNDELFEYTQIYILADKLKYRLDFDL